MVRPEKKTIVEEIRGRLERSEFVFLTNYRGLTVEQLTDLRGRLRRAESRVYVVKNAFLKRAADELGWDDVSGFVDGPMAMITGCGDVTKAAKLLRKFINENELPVLKGGRLGENLLSFGDIKEIAEIPSREAMLGRLMGTVSSPLTRLAGVMAQKLLSLLYALKAVEREKKGEKS